MKIAIKCDEKHQSLLFVHFTTFLMFHPAHTQSESRVKFDNKCAQKENEQKNSLKKFILSFSLGQSHVTII